MRVVKCEQCGRAFKAERTTAKYCSTRCRTAAVRARKALAEIPKRRDGAALVALPKAAPKSESDDEGFVAETKRELEAAGRLEGYLGRSAMHIARLIDAAPSDTGNGHAALIKEYKATMAQALDGAQRQETPLEKIRRERELKTG